MKRYLIILFTLLLASCGYHLGGFKSGALKKMKTYSVAMFANETTFPNVSMQLTTALTDTLQRDGTFTLASADKCDFQVTGSVRSVHETSQRTNTLDTYLSSEIGLAVYVDYKVIDRRTGKVLIQARTNASGSFFNDTGNAQTARDGALSYATRQVAEQIVNRLTLP